MTLSEFIESLDTEMVKIGAENGSGFFFIGPVKELRGDGMQKYEDHMRQYELNRIEDSKKQLQKVKNRQPADEDGEKEKQHLIDSIKARIKNWTDYYESRIPLGDRKVFKSYSPTVYDDGMKIVIVEGDTFGKYWTFDEVKHEHWMAIANNPGVWIQ